MKQRNHAYLIIGLCRAGPLMTQVTAVDATEALEKALAEWETTTTFPVQAVYCGRGRYAENELAAVLAPKEEVVH